MHTFYHTFALFKFNIIRVHWLLSMDIWVKYIRTCLANHPSGQSKVVGNKDKVAKKRYFHFVLFAVWFKSNFTTISWKNVGCPDGNNK